MGIFANTWGNSNASASPAGTFASWRDVWTTVSVRLRRSGSAVSRLAILERITVGPKQTVTLIEVEGEKLLVATSQEGAPQFFRLGTATARNRIETCDRIRLAGKVG